MPLFCGWAELPPELLCRIGDSLDDLKCYASARGACTAWRRALAPPFPSLLVVPDDASFCPSAASLPARRSFELKAIPSGKQCVGSGNGWLALSVDIYSGPSGRKDVYSGQSMFSLFNPVTAAEIFLPPLIHGSRWVCMPKLVFAPNPASDDFVAVTICDVNRLAYVTAGARRWAITAPVRLATGDQLADIFYHDKKARVYCLTRSGDVHVLRLPVRRRGEPIMADDDPSSLPAIPPSIGAPRDRAQLAWWPTKQQYAMIRRRSLGPDLNAPAKVEPLLSFPFDSATSFAPPYNKVSVFTGAKNLVFCEGNMYQIWRNSSCTVTVQVPGGGRRRIAENEVFVLRYYPRRQLCWDAVTDLGGYSVFLGRNNAVSISRAEDVPGLKGNCVYWIGGSGRDQGMVFDMATGRSTPCLPPDARVAPQCTICWYFLNDNVNICNNINGGKRVYQTGVTVQADRERQEDVEESPNCAL